MTSSRSTHQLDDLFSSVYEFAPAPLSAVRYYMDHWLFTEDVEGARILDIGGADGRNALFLWLFRGAMTAVLDEYQGHGADAGNYLLARQAAERLGASEFQVFVGDVKNYGLQHSEWDYIYTRNCLHHIYLRRDPDDHVVDLFRRFYSWLRPGGCLRIGEIGWMNIWGLLPSRLRLISRRIEFSTKSTAWRWCRCAKRAGFEVEYIWWYVPRRLRGLKPLLSNPVANVFLTSSYIISLRKTEDSST